MNKPSREKLPFMVGGLLYTPAINSGLAEKIESGMYPCLTSAAFCLEDSIRDEALESAEAELCRTLDQLRTCDVSAGKMPLIFIRVRNPEHMRHVHMLISPYRSVVTGYILPKFDLSNCDGYRSVICRIHAEQDDPFYIMPILESEMIADVKSRIQTLFEIRALLNEIRDYVLNIRVGGNDFCNLYGLRRSINQNIYQIGVVRDILVDIINVFAADYVVSGPVWEYFGNDPSAPWADGLNAEISLDRLNGFIGKTAIHPSQLPLIFDGMKVTKADYEDAQRILQWTPDSLGVEKSAGGDRMNEVKCHRNWALRIAALAERYGIREESVR